MTCEEDKHAMHDVAEVIAAAAATNPSYAGPFAYDNQGPMKTFMGQQPCVPLPVILDAEQRGVSNQQNTNLRPQDVEALRKVVAMDVASCGLKCAPWQCIDGVAGDSLGGKLGSGSGQTCMKQSMKCYNACIAGNN